MIDLTTIPFAFYFVNQSIHSVLSHYTKPYYTTLDLRELICPECYEINQENNEEKNFIDIFSLNFQNILSNLKTNFLNFINKNNN